MLTLHTSQLIGIDYKNHSLKLNGQLCTLQICITFGVSCHDHIASDLFEDAPNLTRVCATSIQVLPPRLGQRLQPQLNISWDICCLRGWQNVPFSPASCIVELLPLLWNDPASQSAPTHSTSLELSRSCLPSLPLLSLLSPMASKMRRNGIPRARILSIPRKAE